jgi:hypothetical protein
MVVRIKAGVLVCQLLSPQMVGALLTADKRCVEYQDHVFLLLI